MPRSRPRLVYVAAVMAAAALAATATFAAASVLDSGGTSDALPSTPVGVPVASTRSPLPEPDLAPALALLDSFSELRQFGDPGMMQTGTPVPWYDSRGLLGAQFEVTLEQPASGTFDFVVSQYREAGPSARPYERFRLPLTVVDLTSLIVAVDARNGTLAEMSPGDGTEITAQGTPTPY